MVARGHNLTSKGKGHVVNARVERLGCLCGHVYAAVWRRDAAEGGTSRSGVGEVSGCERTLQGEAR